MKKEFKLKGLHAEVHGSLEVFMNHTSEQKKFTHASTHEDGVRTVYMHAIIGKIDGELAMSKRVYDHEDLLMEVGLAEKNLEKQMYNKANSVKKKTIEEKLNLLGYK